MTANTLGLEDEVYDAIVIGTGLPESILSAALSLSGARVLHVDQNAYYGSHHASLRLAELESLARNSGRDTQTTSKTAVGSAAVTDAEASNASKAAFGERVSILAIGMSAPARQAFPLGCRLSLGNDAPFIKATSRITLDLAPRTLLAAGTLVDLLIQTGVGHYLSFRPVDATFLYLSSPESSLGEGLQKVPASRSDVFQSKSLSMVEKRLLMRFLKAQASIDPALGTMTVGKADGDSSLEKQQAAESMRFKDYLEKAKLTGTLQKFVFHCIAFIEDISSRNPTTVSAAAGCDAVRTYLNSLARYETPTPFLCPNYGSGEICEAFCRLSAVHGGTFILRKQVCGLAVLPADSECSSGGNQIPAAEEIICGVVTSDGDQLRAKHVFLSTALRSPDSDAKTGIVWRYTCVLESSAFPAGFPRALTVFPKGCCGNVGATVRVLQVNSTVEMCPGGMYILYAETVGGGGSESDLACALGSILTLSSDDEERFEHHLQQARSMRNPVRPGVESADCEQPLANACEQPRVSWSMWFSKPEASESDDVISRDRALNGISFVRDVGVSVDGTKAVAEAERCFRLARPAGAFFPAKVERTSAEPSTEEINDAAPGEDADK